MTQALITALFTLSAILVAAVLIDCLIKGRARWVYLKGQLA
jgi:hypothetical protein